MLSELPVWALALAIFGLRVIDVSLGTLRTLVVVQGRVPVAMVLGFTEILVWVTALSQVIGNLGQQPALAVAYAGGFAGGNGMGILLERRLALGRTALRIVTDRAGEIADAIASLSNVVASFPGISSTREVNLLYTTCRRRDLPAVIARAQAVDPELFYAVERFAETSRVVPLPPMTGWRAVAGNK